MGSFFSQLVYLAMKMRDAIKISFLRRAVGVEELRYEDLRRRAVTRFATAQTRLGLGIGWQNKAGSSRLANVSTSTSPTITIDTLLSRYILAMGFVFFRAIQARKSWN
jgi:hypothetical protein